MAYKVEIHSTQLFSQGNIFNHTEEKWFENTHELTARNEAFNYFFSISPQKSIEQNLTLYYHDNCNYSLKLCELTLHNIEKYNKEELIKKEFLRIFYLENLHKEMEDYHFNTFDTGPPPLIIEEGIFDIEEDKYIDVSILAANKYLMTENSEYY